jgi:surface carbohydrate biosynthesis protein
MVAPVFFVPIETKVRELDAKILLSCHCAEAGFEVIIGGQFELPRLALSMLPGIYLEKGVAPTKMANVYELRNKGHKVVAWCEEGLVTLDPAKYVRDRVNEKVLKGLELFFAWGQVQAGAISKRYPRQSSKIIITGNPRIDVLRQPYRRLYQDQASRLKERYGPYILLNTNFGIHNNFFGPDFFFKEMMKGNLRIENAAHEQFLRSLVDHVKQVFHHFIELVKQLSKEFSEHTIVLRPHPSEDHEKWRQITSNLSNVQVIHEGSAIPWLMAAEVMIHNSCTTGVEARVLGRPIVAYRPVVSDDFEPWLPKAVSLNTFSLEETTSRVKEILQQEAGEDLVSRHNADNRAALENALNLSGEFACEAISRRLWELQSKRGQKDHSAEAQVEPGRVLAGLNKQLRSAMASALGRNKKGLEYRKQKFPGLSQAELTQKIEILKDISGRFTELQVSKVKFTTSCYRVRSGR